MIVNCTALTCKFEEDGLCTRYSILLNDFSYYKDTTGKEKDDAIDDMRCISYQFFDNWTSKIKK